MILYLSCTFTNLSTHCVSEQPCFLLYLILTVCSRLRTIVAPLTRWAGTIVRQLQRRRSTALSEATVRLGHHGRLSTNARSERSAVRRTSSTLPCAALAPQVRHPGEKSHTFSFSHLRRMRSGFPLCLSSPIWGSLSNSMSCVHAIPAHYHNSTVVDAWANRLFY